MITSNLNRTFGDCAVQIAVRQRPTNNIGDDIISCKNENEIAVDDRCFRFDHVLKPSITQAELYDCVIKPLIEKVNAGFNCTALAYGQTGTGKTYTMGLNTNYFDNENAGVIPRCLCEILATKCVTQNENSTDTARNRVFVSFIEIYNEKAYDLLTENHTEQIPAKGCKFTGGLRKPICTLQDAFEILKLGNKNRHVRPTLMNSQSSRSHAIFTINIVSKNGDRETNSCLNLVDLAGSEGVRRTGHKGVAMSEGVNINQGLLCIGKVLQAMTAGNKVIPYRDSVLSSVLQDSLNTNSYLTLLACISPNREDLNETLSTLRFAHNAKNLKSTPYMNTVVSEIKGITPYKRISHMKTPKGPTKTPIGGALKRSFKSLAPTQSSVSIKKVTTMRHRNTFCTPNKVNRIGKANRSEIGLTPKEKAKANEERQQYPLICNSSYLLNSTNGQTNPSIFDPEDTRLSLMSMNVSSSTTVDASINGKKDKTTISPIVRRFIAELVPYMRQTFGDNMIDTNEKNLQTVCNPTTSSNATAKCQLFPNDKHFEFKKPASPKPIRKVNDSIANTSEDSDSSSRIELDFNYTGQCKTMIRRSCRLNESEMADKTFDLENMSVNDKTVVRNNLRRSIRLKSKNESLNVTTANETITTAPKRRKEKTRSKDLNVYPLSELQIDEVDEIPIMTNKNKKSSKSNLLQNILENSPIQNNLNRRSTKAKPKQNRNTVTKHREAIMELLNEGTMKEIMMLPQVGQKTAMQILTQRKINGKFENISQVKKLPIWRGTAWDRFATANILN